MHNNSSDQNRPSSKEMRKRKWRTLIRLTQESGRPKRTIPISKQTISNDEWDNILSEYRRFVGSDLLDIDNTRHKR